MKPQRILVVEQNGSGEQKVKGLLTHGGDSFVVERWSIDTPLAPIIDDASEFLPKRIEADLVLDFLKHPDLTHDLAGICRRQGIPLVASGKKLRVEGVLTPPTWCGLPRQVALGQYGEQFGAPEFSVKLSAGKIDAIDVVRGAPCGATWEAARRMIDLPLEEAIVRIGLEVQYFCTADPAGWDPIHGKSPVHFAGKVHSAALERALSKLSR